MAILKIKDENGNFVDIPSIVGPQGPQGIQGPQGPAGAIKFTVVVELPTENIDESSIYLKPVEDSSGQNIYEEFIYVSGSWESLGTPNVEIDLTDYIKHSDIETVASTEGTCIKYPDGTMIYLINKSFTEVAVSTAIGSLYESASLVIGNYPVAFINTPQVFIQPLGQFFVRVISAPSTTGFGSFRACRPTTASGMAVNVSAMAIGRWK